VFIGNAIQTIRFIYQVEYAVTILNLLDKRTLYKVWLPKIMFWYNLLFWYTKTD